jgi:soluble lytic murein transglycosylase
MKAITALKIKCIPLWDFRVLIMKRSSFVKNFLFTLVLIALGVFVGKSVITTLYPVKYSEIIGENAEKYGIEKVFLYSLIKAESNFDERAVSRKGARGLMQITESTAAWAAAKMGMSDFNAEMLSDPRVNVEIGCWYISYLSGKFDDISLVIAAYNAGDGNVNKWLANDDYSDDGQTLKHIPYPETRNYVKKVIKYMYIYKNIVGV